jgi:hypothetical protein
MFQPVDSFSTSDPKTCIGTLFIGKVFYYFAVNDSTMRKFALQSSGNARSNATALSNKKLMPDDPKAGSRAYFHPMK